MATFEAHIENEGIADDRPFRVFITCGNGGFSKYGPKVIPGCTTVKDLDAQMNQLLLSLDAAYQAAKAILAINAAGSAAVPDSCAVP